MLEMDWLGEGEFTTSRFCDLILGAQPEGRSCVLDLKSVAQMLPARR